jgi:DnaJ-class molecular chaperone
MLWSDIITDDMQREQARLSVPVQCGACCGWGCPSCSWTGFALDHVTCPSCDGRGQISIRVQEDDGEWYDDLIECGGCEGSGRVTEADAELFYALMMEEAV